MATAAVMAELVAICSTERGLELTKQQVLEEFDYTALLTAYRKAQEAFDKPMPDQESADAFVGVWERLAVMTNNPNSKEASMQLLEAIGDLANEILRLAEDLD